MLNHSTNEQYLIKKGRKTKQRNTQIYAMISFHTTGLTLTCKKSKLKASAMPRTIPSRNVENRAFPVVHFDRFLPIIIASNLHVI